MARRRGSTQRKPPTEKQVQDAVAILYRDYYSDVTEYGDDFIERIKEGEWHNSSDFFESMDEELDGVQRVIYTFQARAGLLSSENHDAYFDEGLGDLDCSEGIKHEVLMFYALRADVLAYMEREGIDVNKNSTFYGSDDEDED